MKKNTTNILLLAVTGVLLFSVLFIGLQLKNSGQTSITTVQKTKAAAVTYSKTVIIGGQTVTSTPIPTPTDGLLAMANPTTSPTETITEFPTESPIESPPETITASASPTIISSLPTTSTFQNTAVLLGFGLFIVFFSFVF